MNEDEFTKTNRDFDIPPLHIRIFYTVILRFVVLFIVTLVFSVASRAIVRSFSGELERGGVILFNFIVIILYFVFLYRFADKSGFMAISLAEYFTSVSVVYLSYSALCILMYFLLDRSVYLWLFRMSASFAGLLWANANGNLLLYIIAFHGLSFIILLTEPLIARIIYRRNMYYFDE